MLLFMVMVLLGNWLIMCRIVLSLFWICGWLVLISVLVCNV